MHIATAHAMQCGQFGERWRVDCPEIGRRGAPGYQRMAVGGSADATANVIVQDERTTTSTAAL